MPSKIYGYDRVIASLSTLKLACYNAVGLRVPDNSLYAPVISPATAPQSELDQLYLTDAKRGTILYLAYGSNLSIEKFRNSRGIKPLSQINVQVPNLRLTFDLPGVPYSEPCFANSGRRDPDADRPTKEEKELHFGSREYNKNKWHKGLIGVVYEVTPEDYAHIIATEGGGSGYQDIMIDCYPFASSDTFDEVPQDPESKPFKAHTLFAPSLPDGKKPPNGGRFARPDQSYAQPSARYLKLITDGAAELGLPNEYQHYLKNIRPFRITAAKQKIGQALLIAVWGPIIMFIFGLAKIFADKNGLIPKWLARLSSLAFRSVWTAYDNFFKPVFGEGERSIPDVGSA